MTKSYNTDYLAIKEIAEETGSLDWVQELGDNVIIVHLDSYRILIDLPQDYSDTNPEYWLSTIRYEDDNSYGIGEEKNQKVVKTLRGVKGYINKFSN